MLSFWGIIAPIQFDTKLIRKLDREAAGSR